MAAVSRRERRGRVWVAVREQGKVWVAVSKEGRVLVAVREQGGVWVAVSMKEKCPCLEGEEKGARGKS